VSVCQNSHRENPTNPSSANWLAQLLLPLLGIEAPPREYQGKIRVNIEGINAAKRKRSVFSEQERLHKLDIPLTRIDVATLLSATQLLLEQEADPNALIYTQQSMNAGKVVNKDQMYPLFNAVKARNLACARVLIEYCALLNASVPMIGTCLYAAVESGYPRMVELLLEAGADVNAAFGIEGTALKLAALKGSLELVQMLLKYGANVDGVGNSMGSGQATLTPCGPQPTWTPKNIPLSRLSNASWIMALVS
jgi:hypothetical protein